MPGSPSTVAPASTSGDTVGTVASQWIRFLAVFGSGTGTTSITLMAMLLNGKDRRNYPRYLETESMGRPRRGPLLAEGRMRRVLNGRRGHSL
jgi:hypothetical protein